MITALFRYWFQLKNWKINADIPPEAYESCVIVAAPHTSNWDFIYMIAALSKMDIPYRFTIKKEFKKIPLLGSFLTSLGAIWIDRTPKNGKKTSMVDAMAALFSKHPQLAVIVSAEGTRSLTLAWKSGYYYVAEKANVPILLGYVDYKHKECGIGKPIWPSGNMEDDLQKVMDFYRTISPKFPHKHSLDTRYASAQG